MRVAPVAAAAAAGGSTLRTVTLALESPHLLLTGSFFSQTVFPPLFLRFLFA